MPVCESPTCNAPILYMPKTTKKGRRVFVAVNPPEERFIESLNGTLDLLETYQLHRETCLDRNGKKADD